MNVACVGAGPAGLFFSILMKERWPEHEITVFERNPPGITHGWGVVFWDDLLDEVEAADAQTARVLATHAFRWSGEQLQVADREPVKLEFPGYAIGRQRLLDLLLERATRLGVRVRFETKVEHLSELGDADLIAVCDGANSRLRHALRQDLGARCQTGSNKFICIRTDVRSDRPSRLTSASERPRCGRGRPTRGSALAGSRTFDGTPSSTRLGSSP
jgi:anthraniloyl-CoA monooxygenase